MAPLFTLPPTCRLWIPTGSILNLSIFAKGNCRYLHLNLPLWVTNKGALNRTIKRNIWRRCRAASLFKIGELHTIFYLCFLVLLVYLSVFSSLSFIKNQKNSYLACCCNGFLREHQ